MLFPLFSWWFDAALKELSFTLDSVAELHRLNPLHYVIDSAPLFLGVFAAYAGYRQDLIDRLNHQLELRVEQRGKELNKIVGEFKQMESERISIEQGYSRANTDLARFSYIIAHDLKAPLVAINNLSEWIEDEMGSSFSVEAKTQFQLLRSRVLRLNLLLESIQEYFAINREEGKLVDVNLERLFRELFEAVKSKNSILEISVPSTPVKLNKKHFRKLIFELLENAIQHNSADRKKIVVTAKENDQSLLISIADNGDGIDLKYKDDAFALLKTLEARDKLDTAGVGLAIAKRITELNNAQIELNSEPQKGSVFTIKWPLQNK